MNTIAANTVASATASPAIETSWIAIQTMNNDMRQLAKNEEWIQVMELAVVRHQRLLDHFAAFPVGPENSAFYRERIGTMLSGEQHLQDLATEARKAVMSAAMINNQNHRAVGAYLNTAVG